MTLGSKYEVASAADAVAHPYYWQIFHLVDSPPQLIVDCGANCGHFTVVADVCLRTRFGQSAERYVAVEPNPMLLPILRRTFESAGIADRTEIVHGLLGCEGPRAEIWVHPKDYLISSLSPRSGATAHSVPCVRLADLLKGDQPIDVMKVDIEGGEYEFLRREPSLFQRAVLLFVEVHAAKAETTRGFFDHLREMGFVDAGPRVEHCGQQLITLRRNPSEKSTATASMAAAANSRKRVANNG